MLINLRQWGKSLAAMSLHQELGVLIEGAWLLIIFLLPVYFNHFCFNGFYFIKVLTLVLLVSLLLGLVLAQWFLGPQAISMGGLTVIIRKSPLQFIALVLGLIWVVSTVFSIMPAKSLWGNLSESVGFLPNLAWIIFFMILSHKVKDRAQVLRALYVLLISSGIVSLLGVLQLISPDILQGHQVNGRVYSTDGNPLSLSGFLAMAMPVTLALAILNWYGWGPQPRGKSRFAVLFALFGLQLCCLVFAQYSITLLLFIIGIFVFFALIGIFLRRRATMIMSVLAVLLVVIIAFVLLGQILLTEETRPLVEKQDTAGQMAGQGLMNTLTVRMQIWKCAADVIIDSPELPFNIDGLHFLRRFIGYGPETFMATSQMKFPAALRSEYVFNFLSMRHPENHYLYLAVTLGIMGLMAFLALLAVFFTLGFRLLARSNNKETIVLAAAFVAAIAQYCAHVFFNPSYIVPELVFWLVLGLTIALAKIDAGGADCSPGTVMDDCATGAIHGPGKLRKLMSVLIIIIFVAIGSALTLPLLPANMLVRSGFNLWGKDQGLALTSFTQATLTGPRQADYYDILGNIAFIMANQPTIASDVKNMLLDLSESSGNTAIQLEPQLAMWRYRLADRGLYRIVDGSAENKTKVLYLYQEADLLFPGNAVILNKWAMALMLVGDYDEAGRKLAEAGQADPLWTQTFFYSGLLKSLEGHREAAGEMFVLPGKGHYRLVRTVLNGLNDIDYFINFCGQAANYGVIGRVADDLKYYADDKNDWIAWTFLGIADIYAGRAGEAMEAFSKSAELIPAEDIAELKGVIMGIPWNTPALQAVANDIIESLIARQVK